MTAPADISAALRLMMQLIDSLPDGMDVAVREIWDEWRTCPADKRAAAADNFAEWIAEVCHEEGFPSPLGEPPAVAVITPEGPGRLEP